LVDFFSEAVGVAVGPVAAGRTHDHAATVPDGVGGALSPSASGNQRDAKGGKKTFSHLILLKKLI
jgi:hypothetical protein